MESKPPSTQWLRDRALLRQMAGSRWTGLVLACDQCWELCTVHVLPKHKQDQGSKPRRKASRISERLLTYAISFALMVLGNIMETQMFPFNMDKKIMFFFIALFPKDVLTHLPPHIPWVVAQTHQWNFLGKKWEILIWSHGYKAMIRNIYVFIVLHFTCAIIYQLSILGIIIFVAISAEVFYDRYLKMLQCLLLMFMGIHKNKLVKVTKPIVLSVLLVCSIGRWCRYTYETRDIFMQVNRMVW